MQRMAELSTEERILEAATAVFTEKGFEATKTRDIAEAAGINIASLHYYFRSKEKLFGLIIEDTMGKFSKLMDTILNGERPLHEKIRLFVPAYTDFLKQNSFIPMFILSESQKNPDKIDRMMNDQQTLDVLKRQITELVEEGKIRPISIPSFFSNLIGMTVFPFLSKQLLKLKTELTEQMYMDLLEERKTMVPEIIINHLYYEPPQ